MGAEYELKFRADEESLTSIFTTFPARWQTIAMETTYYDTPSHSLSQRRWTLRRRMENSTSVCTLKTPGKGLERGEWEVKCQSIETAIPELCKLGGPAELTSLCKEGLLVSCGARFTRRAGVFTLRDCVMELALDQGVLIGGGKEIPLCELEVECKEGSREAMEAFAIELADIYGLQREEKSKFARALALCEE
jgi:inorganic triphosphatase YgiF